MICLTWSPLTGGLGESYHPWRAVALTASRSDLGSAEPAADLGQQVHLFVTGAKACCRGRRFALFAELLGQVSTLRSRTGRPHWLIVDEAHHLLPSERADVVQTVPEEIPAAIFIAVHPESVSRNALKNVAVVLALGDSAPAAIKAFCNALGIAEPSGVTKPNLQEIVYWPRYLDDPPRIIKPDRQT